MSPFVGSAGIVQGQRLDVARNAPASTPRGTREIEVILPRLHRAQRQIMAEAQRFNVLECGRRFGKSITGQRIVARCALDGQPAAWFAPTYKYLLPIWQETKRRLRDCAERVNEQERSIELITGGVVDFWTLEDDRAGRGRKYRTVVVDEASFSPNLEQAWEQAIRPTLADLRGSAWFLFTPKGKGNYAHRLFLRAEQGATGWKCWRKGTSENPFIPRDEIDEAERELPRSVFEQEFLGIPSDDGGNPFGIDAIRKRVLPALAGNALVCSTEPVKAWGWDLAKSLDWTVGVGLDAQGRVSRFERFRRSWDETEAVIGAALSEAPAAIDSTGVGDPIFERLRRRFGSRVEGYVFSSRSKQQLMEGLAVAIHRGEVSYPDGVIVSELETFEYSYSKTGVKYEAPSGLHDDAVCALSLAVHKLRTGGGSLQIGRA